MKRSQVLVDIKGEVVGVGLKSIEDTNIMTFYVEDDGLWYETDLCLDVEWVDDMIAVLQKVKSRLE